MRNATILLAVAAMLALAVPAWGDTSWDAGTGNWFTDTNWTNNKPITTEDAYIENAGTAQIGAAGAVADDLYVGGTSTGAVELGPNGSLDTTHTHIGRDGTGTFTQTGGTHESSLYSCVGWSGTGAYTHNAGTFTVGNYFHIGNQGGTGEYNLSGSGVLSVGELNLGTYGPTSNGAFNQSGGTVSITGALNLHAGNGTYGTGNYNISAGELDADSCTVGSTNAEDLNYKDTFFVEGLWTVTDDKPIEFGSYTQNASGILAYEIDGNDATGITKIDVTDEAAFAGTLKVTLKAGTSLTEDHYVLMKYGSDSGTFTEDMSALPAGWHLDYDKGADGNELWLVPEPATLALLSLGGLGVLLRRRRR